MKNNAGSEQEKFDIKNSTVARMNPDVTIREELEEDGKHILFQFHFMSIRRLSHLKI